MTKVTTFAACDWSSGSVVTGAPTNWIGWIVSLRMPWSAAVGFATQLVTHAARSARQQRDVL